MRFIIVAAALAAGLAGTAGAQDIGELRDELRELRRAVMLSARAQILVQRLGMQQQRADLLLREDADVRRRLAEAAADEAEAQGAARAWEKRLNEQAANSGWVAEYRGKMDEARVAADRAAVLGQQLKQQLADLFLALERENARLDALSAQVAEIEKSLQ